MVFSYSKSNRFFRIFEGRRRDNFQPYILILPFSQDNLIKTHKPNQCENKHDF